MTSLKVIHRVIWRSGATKQSNKYKYSQYVRLLRSACNDGISDFLRTHQFYLSKSKFSIDNEVVFY